MDIDINEVVTEITTEVGRHFRSFGGGKPTGEFNPLSHWMKDKPLSFALGVDVRTVVIFVIGAFVEHLKADGVEIEVEQDNK